MNTGRLSLLTGSFSLVLVLLLACSQVAAPIPTPAPSPTQKPTVTAPAVSSSAAKPAPTEVPVSFAGKTITVVVPYSAGGRADTIARLWARHLGRFLPGNPSLIVRNIPGGEGTIGANYVYFSKPDGLTILNVGSSVVMGDLLDRAPLKFSSLTEMTSFVAVPAASDLYFVAPTLISKPEDIVKTKGIVYGGAAGAHSTMIIISVAEFLGVQMAKVVSAYSGGSDSRRAFLSGEINCANESVLLFDQGMRPYYEKGEIRILFQSGMFDEAGNIVRHPSFPADTLTAKELYERLYGKSPSGPAYEAYRAMLAAGLHIPMLVLPPGTPDNLVKTYWTAAENMARDPDFRKSADPVGGTGAKWMAGAALDKVFKTTFGLKPEIRSWLRDIMSTKYGMVLE